MSSQRGNRNPTSQQRREARRYIFETSYRDRQQSETVSRVGWMEVVNYLLSKHEHVDTHVALIEHGEVLTDSRGRGTFQ